MKNPNKGIEALRKEAPEVVKQMGYKKGGKVKKCKRDGICKKGKTKGRMV